MFGLRSKNFVFLTLVAMSSQLTSCYIDASDKNKDPSDGTITSSSDDYTPYWMESGAKKCDGILVSRYSDAHYMYCYETDSSKWNFNCKSDDCREVPVNVFYMLQQDIGDGKSVNVEAFDNEHFAGNPESTARITGFKADKPGEYSEAKLYLPPGQYFLRAYIANDDETVAPYSYGGMTLVNEKPVGVYGALSSPQSVTVQPSSEQDNVPPVSIYLDQLFKKPQSDTPTQANLRIQFSTSETVPEGRNVVIQLFSDSDFKKAPVATYNMPSEDLLVSTKPGKADYIMNDLPTGSYFVVAFLDLNSNGYRDAGEPANIYSENGQAKLVVISEKRTETILMTLTKDK